MNWQTLIKQIQSSGLSQMQIAERLGRSQAWVSAVSQGKYRDVSWADGQAIIALSSEACPDANSPVAVDPENHPKTEPTSEAA